MLQLSFENHFRFGYENSDDVFRKNAEQTWRVNYGKCHRIPFSFASECIRTATLISQQAKSKIWVLFSGGMDSEVVLRSFLLAGVDVSVAILRYKNDLNLHDISFAISACEKLGVKYYLFDLDLIDFWQGEGVQYAVRSQCVTPALTPAMWLMDQIDGYPVLGSGDCYLERRQEWVMFEREKIASWYKHLMQSGREGCPGFFQYTPEIMQAFLLEPEIIQLTQNENPIETSSLSTKVKIYQKTHALECRPKFTGFEKVQDTLMQHRESLCLMLPGSDQAQLIPYYELLEQLSQN